ncbi:uncharacterized protein K460DRAFT_374438 [Cucurbitaria berberidis CBS 394.84]|uniref:Pinin/SDK/MemA protein domain-containing protein n=1 Tax=Cucurbitaria berberidis CBS 394.84 TaxID=1168544 RepID=A0A9P4GLC9_9PLEO|nr:uncharacterized protein K460DRAFT_374438 [Cucurbitaria berberidis CBS 394.84]KAF1847362.1 hypothetical protein K460DRAFT_374438 [Cucurbitaria berberidis CBS 394.84]
MDGPIASAVVLPDDLSVPASPVNSHKRRQSSISEENAKRPRLNDDGAPTERRGSSNGTKPAATVRRERGRERRLFGAVLGALSQNPTTSAQKRRSEIEKRQLARRQLEAEEGEQRKAECVAGRKVQRWKEQKHFEKDSMRARHENLLSMAHFLQTEAEPHLYYKPWETNPDEDERIRDQIAEAHEVIEREVEEYEARQRQEAQRERHASGNEEVSRDAAGSHTGKNYNAHAPPELPTTNGGTNSSADSPKDRYTRDDHTEDPRNEAVRDAAITEDVVDTGIPGRETTADELSKEHDDDNGEDVVEEAAEDTVIY